MEETKLEPGFLQALRLFVAVQILFWAIIGPVLIAVEVATGTRVAAPTGGQGVVENLTPANTSRMIAVELVLLLLLFVPQVPRRLGRWFVPLALLIALVPLLIGYYWWPSQNPLQTPFVIFFFVLLVLIAWLYPFGHVLAYVLGLSLYQLAISASETSVPLGLAAGYIVLQGVMMLLVGYVIVTLVSVQREQRAALAKTYEQQAAANARLKRYTATLEELTISRERNRLARELHDTLAHSLSAVAVQLEAVRSLWQVDPQAARDMLENADESARTGLTESRRALQALRASPLQELGLAAALRELAETAAQRTSARLDLQVPDSTGGDLPSVVEQGVYRIAQEALENVVRHAGARSIAVHLERGDGELTLQIRDDGRGAGLEALPPSEMEDKIGLGIRGMQERANVIGGKLQIEEPAGEGTLVRLTVPIRDQRTGTDGSRSDL